MGAHRLIRLVRDVINWEDTRAFYREFGLTEVRDGVFSTVVGGEQLVLREADRPAVARIDIGVEDEADLDVIERRFTALGVASERSDGGLEANEPVTGVRVRLEVYARLPKETPPPQPELRRDDLVPRKPLRPQRLGHVVLGSHDVEAAKVFFVEGIGMRLSDYVTGGPFLRFETDHHNIVLVPAPFTLLHHTAWKVRSVDEIGWGGSHMIENHPLRHAWGLGRHAASANYFWYLRDPSGAFAEYYYSEMDERAPDEYFWDQLPDPEELPVSVWASPPLEDAPLRFGKIMDPYQLPAPILSGELGADR